MKISKTRTMAMVACVAAISLLTAGPARADNIRDDQWHLRFLKVAEAQRITKGAGVIVAVVDSGVYPHPDLRKNLLKGTDVLPGGTRDGQVDQNGHGTEMAGLIAGHGRNANDGVLGIAPAAKILPVKEVNAQDNGGSSTIAAGIDWAATHGAKIINVSSATGPSSPLQDAIAQAEAADAVVVASSGNLPKTVTFGYPAAMPGVLAVGAVDRSGKHAAISMPGPAVQICAPGVDITSTEPKNRYAEFDGTSPATAIVSGAAALVRAKFPDLSAQEVIHRLTATATDIGKPGRDNECGYGVLNIVKALTANVPPLTAATPPTATAPAESTTQPPATTPAANPAPVPKPAGRNTPAIIGGVVLALLLGGLLTLLGIRRRKARPKS